MTFKVLRHERSLILLVLPAAIPLHACMCNMIRKDDARNLEGVNEQFNGALLVALTDAHVADQIAPPSKSIVSTAAVAIPGLQP